MGGNLLLDEVRERLGSDLKAAMKAQASVDVRALRALMGALDNATAVEVVAVRPGRGPTEVARRELTAPEIDGVIGREVRARKDAIARYEALGLGGEAEEFRREVAVLERYLVEAHRRPSDGGRFH